MAAQEAGSVPRQRAEDARNESIASAVGQPKRPPLKVSGLFAGVGGIELGLHAAGHRTELLCEIDSGADEVLRDRFGLTPHEDVRELDAFASGTELVTAGFPCQDLSQAGGTAGILGSRSGLVGEVFRLLESDPVRWVLIENVPFMLQLAGGRAMDLIVSRFEELGYRWAYRIVDTLAFGLPQRRRRVFFLASREEDPRRILFADSQPDPTYPEPAKARSFGFYWTEGVRGLGSAVDAIPTLKGGSSVGIPSPPAVLLPRRKGRPTRIVTPTIEDAERLQGFPSGWTEASDNKKRPGHRWHLVGNAVSVPVAVWIGHRLRRPGLYDGGFDRALPPGSKWPSAAWSDGQGRFEASMSSAPVALDRLPIHQFLTRKDRLLSERATAGFLRRLASSRLRQRHFLLGPLEEHLARVGR